METEIVKGLTTGQITGGTLVGTIIATLGFWAKKKSDKEPTKKVESTAELELRLLKYLTTAVIDSMKEMNKESNASNEKIALLFLKNLEDSKESQAIINESFNKVYTKIEHTQDNWVHNSTFSAFKENLKNKD